MDEEEVAPVAATSKRSYRSIKEKLDLCLQSEIVVNQEKQLSFRQFCHNHSVAPSNLRAWKRNIKMLKEAVMSKKSSIKTLNKGNPTSLHHIKDVIMEWINGKREKGMALSTRMVILRVSRMDPTFRMDESVMLQWVDRVLKPWSETVPENIVPYLLLDLYKVHLMTTVTQQIESLGIEVDHIPGGCTGLAQPIDVGIGKPFKNRVRHKWEDWMLDGTIDEDVTKPPTCLQVVEWCCNSFRELEGTIVCNAWLNGRFSYFPVTSEETIDVDDCEDDEEPEYIDVAPQEGNVYHLVVDNDVNINDVVEAEEV